MRKLSFLLLLLSSFQALSQTSAQTITDPYEVGVILGEPTGLSGKYWFTNHSAFDAVTAWSFSQAVFELGVDYQYHYFWPNITRGQLPVYLGLGVGLQLGNRDGETDGAFLGIRVPLGAEYIFANAPLAAFAEFVPIFEVLPSTKVRPAGGIGLRFTF